MLIIPAIDVIGDQCVRLKQGDYNQVTRYPGTPLELAQRFADEGAAWLHVVDLEGAKAGEPRNLSVLRDIRAGLTSPLSIELGGGLTSDIAIDEAIAAGVDRVILGSILTRAEESWIATTFARLGERAVAGIDTSDGRVATHGWLQDSGLDGVDFAKRLAELGCRRIIWTDIARDGTLEGPNLEGLRRMVEAVPIPIVASGGVATLDDIRPIAETGVESVIIGKALYEGRFTVAQAIQLAQISLPGRRT